MVRPAIRERWQDLRSSLWFVPAIEVALAIVLSTVTVWLDAAHGDWLRAKIPLVFGGTAEGARNFLSVVAGSLISVVAVMFSITIIALQQAATQYTPRVLRNFMRDRGNQIVLGTYIATFTYALLVLRQVRADEGDATGFMPSLSILICTALVLVDLALLVYFIHHTSQSLQVGFVIGAIRADLDAALNRHFSDEYRGVEPPSFEEAVLATRSLRRGHECVVRASRDGYVRDVDDASLVDELPGDANLVCVPVRVGDYVFRSSVIARVWTRECAREGLEERIASAFVIRRSRTTIDDPFFGIRQISDIALKALSPGINDPTTAEEAIDALAAVVAVLIEREMPSPSVDLAGGGRLVRRGRTYADYVDECFAQIRRAARHEPHVLGHLIDALSQLASRAHVSARAEPIVQQLDELIGALQREEDATTPGDRRNLTRKAEAVLGALPLAARRSVPA